MPSSGGRVPLQVSVKDANDCNEPQRFQPGDAMIVLSIGIFASHACVRRTSQIRITASAGGMGGFIRRDGCATSVSRSFSVKLQTRSPAGIVRALQLQDYLPDLMTWIPKATVTVLAIAVIPTLEIWVIRTTAQDRTGVKRTMS